MNLEIIAEFAQNNIDSNGKVFSNIGEMIKTLAEKGATTVKFQYFKVENIDMESRWDIVKKYELPIEKHIQFKKMCEDANIKYFCTPFCIDTLDDLLDIGVREIKIASCDCGHLQFMSDIVERKDKIDRVILSTGMSTMEEIDASVKILLYNRFKIDLLHCVGVYPTPLHKASLGRINVLKESYGKFAEIGYSDHTLGIESAEIARAMGCTIFEKHITPDITLTNIPDHASSYPISKFEKYVEAIKNIDIVMGDEHRAVHGKEVISRNLMKRGIWFKKDLKIGHKITRDDVIMRRPLEGTVNSFHYFSVLDRKIKKAIKQNDPVIMEDLYE